MEYIPYSSVNPSDIVQKYFYQYELDWTMKNWENMQTYLTEEYHYEQKYLFENDFSDNYDINYDPQIDIIVPIKVKSPRERNDNRYGLTLEFQVNANMINFEVNPYGKVVSGKPKRRSFTDYWTCTYDTVKNQWLLDNIRQG